MTIVRSFGPISPDTMFLARGCDFFPASHKVGSGFIPGVINRVERVSRAISGEVRRVQVGRDQYHVKHCRRE